MLNVQPEPGVVAAHVGAAYELAAPVIATLLRRGFTAIFDLRSEIHGSASAS